MPALAADSRPRRFGNTISTSRRYAPGPSRANSYNIQNSDQQNRSKNLISSPFPPLKSAAAPARRAGMESLLMMDDVTKLLSGVMSRLALQGDGPLREPSPRQQGILCAVVNR